MKRLLTLIACIGLLLLSQCSGNKNDTVITIKTNYGNMVAILYDETPKHKENFIKLAKEGYYNDLLFHRIIQGFMIQGGDPDSKNATPGQPLGMGGPGYTVEAEINPKFFHEKGSLSAARLGDQQNPGKASSGSQFYIVQGTIVRQTDADGLRIDQAKLSSSFQKIIQDPNNQPLIDSLNQLYMTGDMQAYQRKIYSLVPRIEKMTGQKIYKEVSPEKLKAYTTVGGAPHLDGEYTVFGKIISGLDVIDKIAAVPTEQERPVEDVSMTVTVEELPRKKITELYGYQYPN
ncbi:MAG TPA: peptidylprolyl isomerase [Cyclobacteriaceae bacterium]|jgi:peptidyl-prolyl cis-trans isomerase B (cyclophilin B)|nr:peptidylprolyl isomerase [Cytophagales bacterium]HNT49862.1 peptidylprolyl isomerase [Cyclobacteriaceae bacterium]HRE66445.1 peptidylprolyl isomerase [Cyclobacteriaceae bacterium]HRF32022.1 peptidylprolyl isomerase [Cyclobacteriaceae bacterium]